MQIIFDNAKVKIPFEDLENIQGHQGLMQRSIGNELTKAVKKRYSALKAADNFLIYLTTGLGKPHSLTGEFQGCYGIYIDANNRLVVEPVCEDTEPETLRCYKVVNIRGVVDYHDKKSNWLIP